MAICSNAGAEAYHIRTTIAECGIIAAGVGVARMDNDRRLRDRILFQTTFIASGEATG